jgi:hypothetical protein
MPLNHLRLENVKILEEANEITLLVRLRILKFGYFLFKFRSFYQSNYLIRNLVDKVMLFSSNTQRTQEFNKFKRLALLTI